MLTLLRPYQARATTTPARLINKKDFGSGLIFEQYNHPQTGTFHLIRIKLSSEKWRVQPAINPEGVTKCGTVQELALMASPDAVCSVNASFFDPGYYPVGTVAISGQIVSLDNRERSMLGIKSGDGIAGRIKPRAFITAHDYFEPIWIWGYNHPPKKDSIVAYNQHWGSDSITLPVDGRGLVIEDEKVTMIVERDSLPIPRNGLSLLFMGKSRKNLTRFNRDCNVTLGVMMPDEWEGVIDIITGGPRLIDNGRVVDFKNNLEEFETSLFKPHKRSIAGLTWNNEFFFTLFTKPVTYEVVSSVLLEINIREAIGLDGGSSSSLWIRGIRSINGSKKVPVALAIVPREGQEHTQQEIPFFNIHPANEGMNFYK